MQRSLVRCNRRSVIRSHDLMRSDRRRARLLAVSDAVDVAMLAAVAMAALKRGEGDYAAERADDRFDREALEERAQGREAGAYDGEGGFDEGPVSGLGDVVCRAELERLSFSGKEGWGLELQVKSICSSGSILAALTKVTIRVMLAAIVLLPV